VCIDSTFSNFLRGVICGDAFSFPDVLLFDGDKNFGDRNKKLPSSDGALRVEDVRLCLLDDGCTQAIRLGILF